MINYNMECTAKELKISFSDIIFEQFWRLAMIYWSQFPSVAFPAYHFLFQHIHANDLPN